MVGSRIINGIRHMRTQCKHAVERQYSCSSSSFGDVPREKADCVVIGGGVVGIAVARELALAGRHVLLLEAASGIGTVTSSRNSQVIHAGIYYSPQSLKARLCVKGRKMLYDYCALHGVPHKKLGKLIVATTESQKHALEKLQSVGIENGVTDLRMMEREEAMAMEPQLHCVKALWSPSTGIIDSHSFMLALQGEAEEHGTTFAFNTSVFRGHINENGIHLHISDTKDMCTFVHNPNAPAQIILTANVVINSAGLSATSLARRFYGFPSQSIPNTYYARGCYFTLSETRKVPFSHLIYPVPEDGGLGVHATLDMSGQIRFGPDVEWMPEIDDTACFLNMFEYTVDHRRAELFYPKIRNYYPKLKDGTLRPDYSGIRPKLSGQGQPAADFVIQGKETHGIPGLVNLFGIESPGLTASMAIAEMVSVIVSQFKR
ncbi:L-2-hydroxyglutarate dehydrogenase, mitochondrial isoform X2 [Cryptomeria japonica]|uniref:L-2-hydroxyglutarate dehydrogenase, mitochondrial isoform X2 n=1 Tax=Cryptomeria japonica TaxID=3369 RepID=UPI0027DA80E2|nr:L-2-hydroxyglutarate dehydrogenase, mitochondrial isoform X2 [Cryptomeria japonica]